MINISGFAFLLRRGREALVKFRDMNSLITKSEAVVCDSLKLFFTFHISTAVSSTAKDIVRDERLPDIPNFARRHSLTNNQGVYVYNIRDLITLRENIQLSDC